MSRMQPPPPRLPTKKRMSFSLIEESPESQIMSAQPIDIFEDLVQAEGCVPQEIPLSHQLNTHMPIQKVSPLTFGNGMDPLPPQKKRKSTNENTPHKIQEITPFFNKPAEIHSQVRQENGGVLHHKGQLVFEVGGQCGTTHKFMSHEERDRLMPNYASTVLVAHRTNGMGRSCCREQYARGAALVFSKGECVALCAKCAGYAAFEAMKNIELGIGPYEKIERERAAAFRQMENTEISDHRDAMSAAMQRYLELDIDGNVGDSETERGEKLTQLYVEERGKLLAPRVNSKAIMEHLISTLGSGPTGSPMLI